MILFPYTEGIKYAGSKRKLLPYILELVSNLPSIYSILDGFTGTTRVAQALAQVGYSITANDIAPWSEVIATCYLKSDKPDSYYQEILDYLNNRPGYEGWFTTHYGGDEQDSKKPFQRKNTKKLDAIRDAIEALSLSFIDKSVILTSLIYALDKVDSTLGHFTSYLSTWSRRSYHDLILSLPRRFPLTSSHEVLREDIFSALTHKEYDCIYLDPPYGSNNEKMPPSRVRYNSYYHFWKTVILHDKPDVFGKAHRRVDSRDNINPSPFEEYRKSSDGNLLAIQALDRLIASAKTRYIILSYSSGGRATKSALLDILHSHGHLIQSLEIDYQKNIMASMSWTHKWVQQDTQHKEYLFILQK